MAFKDSGFEHFYPIPSDLTAPLDDTIGEYPYEFNYFANFHMTYKGMSLCIRKVRNRFAVCCRGWLPVEAENANFPLVYNHSWTVLSRTPYFHAALHDFLSYGHELLSMSPARQKVFLPPRVVSMSDV